MMTKSDLQKLLAQNVAEILQQGADLLGAVSDEFYSKAEKNAFADGGAIGVHFRHCLEFVNCFLNGARCSSSSSGGGGRVDYDKRARDHRIEANRTHAIHEYKKAIQILENMVMTEAGNTLLVRAEDIASEDENEDFWCASSVERELEFLQSHTIHHYALIAFKLRSFGFELPAEFGVAPSTLRFWRQQNAAGK